MNRRILVVAAVTLIIVAVILMIPQGPTKQKITVFKATRDIEPGTIITADMVVVEVEEITEKEKGKVEAAPPNQVVGTIAKKLIEKETEITQEAIEPLSPRSAALYLNKEVISFYAEIDEAVGGILKPGDFIDIYAYHLVQENEPARMDKTAACIQVVDSRGISGEQAKWPEAQQGEGGTSLLGMAGAEERVVPASIVTVAVEKKDIAWKIIEFLGSRGFRAWVTLSQGDKSCWMPTPTPTSIAPTPTSTPTPTPIPPTSTPSPMPDLRVVSITSDPSPMVKDQSGTVLVKVENRGAAAMVTTCLVGLYIDRPAEAKADKLMVCPPLEVSESAVISYTVTLDEAGYHLLTAWADVLEAISEMDETNNQDSAPILVAEPPTPTPTPTPTNTPPPTTTPVTPSVTPSVTPPSVIHLIFNQWWLDIPKVVDLEGHPVQLELKPAGENIYYSDYHGFSRGLEMTVKNNGKAMRVWRGGELGADVFINGQDTWEKIPIAHGQELPIKVQLRAGFNEATVILVDN
jgi:hypothetical protein